MAKYLNLYAAKSGATVSGGVEYNTLEDAFAGASAAAQMQQAPKELVYLGAFEIHETNQETDCQN